MLREKIPSALAAAHRKQKASLHGQRIDLRPKRQKSFLSFLRAQQSNEEITDSDLITAFSAEIPADADPGDVVTAAEATADQIIAAHRLGGRTVLTAVVLGSARLLDNN